MAEKPNPYPSPQMQQQQYSYDPSGQHPSEAYRSSPTGPSMSQAPSLPPIHHLEGQEIQQQPQYVPVVMNGAPMQQHQPPYPPPSYQYQNGAMQQAMPSNGHANGQTGMMRFPIPPQSTLESRQMSGGRHKKEIKRRTKTGCLTCRKRRIKVSAYIHCQLRMMGCCDKVASKNSATVRSEELSEANSLASLARPNLPLQRNHRLTSE